MTNYLAAINVGTIKGPGTGPLSNITSANAGTAGTLFGKILSTSIAVMTIVAAIWFLFKIVLGGIAIINSDGDKQAVEHARGSITNGVIGLVVILSATFLAGLVGFLLGIDNILNVAYWINNI